MGSLGRRKLEEDSRRDQNLKAFRPVVMGMAPKP
jgi:hypothetical protein